jgi:acylphosphatase
VAERVAGRVVVYGRVQGVFFRDSTRREAGAAGVAGWVRNAPDGTVLAHLEGPADAVDRVLTFMARGPSEATVTTLDVKPVEPEGLTGFELC